MPIKRPVDRKPTTDEWGLYDPAEAGMPALFARLGRPVLRQSEAAVRREKRRATRPVRSADGVCLAIEEVKRRAQSMTQTAVTLPESDTPTVAEEIVARGKRKRAAVKTARTASPAPGIEPNVSAAPREAAAKTGKSVRTAAAGRKPARKAAAAKAEAAAPSRIPAPSPRRPRGPVPLAAWAHAVTDTPAPVPKSTDARGLWRSLFRIPSEVALVEYGRGCKIHRLVIETSDTPESY